MSKFELWDVVRVKDYEEMLREFGRSRFGHIKTQFPFVSSMKYLCGQQLTIRDILEDDLIRSVEGIECDDNCTNDEGYWYISEDMLKLVHHRKDYTPASNGELELLFA